MSDVCRTVLSGRSRFAVLVAITLCTLAVVPRAQEEPIGARLERVTHIRADAAETFLDTLRRAVGRNEHAAACALLAYPLSHATGTVESVADCERRYDSIFTIAVRKAIGTQRFEDLFAADHGVMIGMGEVWFGGSCALSPCVRPSDLHVTAITSSSTGLLPPKGKVLLACFVSGQRVRVAADGEGGASLSVWRDARRFRSAPPDLDFPHAAPSGPPTTCGSRSWTFDDGTRTYVVSELPCDAYLNPPPMGSVGRVTLSTRDTPGVPLWCVEGQ